MIRKIAIVVMLLVHVVEMIARLLKIVEIFIVFTVVVASIVQLLLLLLLGRVRRRFTVLLGRIFTFAISTAAVVEILFVLIARVLAIVVLIMRAVR